MLFLQCVHRLREFEEKEKRQRQCIIAVSANLEEDVTGMDGFDLQRYKPLREKDILQCMRLYDSKVIPLRPSPVGSGGTED